MNKILFLLFSLLLTCSVTTAQTKKGKARKSVAKVTVKTPAKKEVVKVDYPLTMSGLPDSLKVGADGIFSIVVETSTKRDKCFELVRNYLMTTDKYYVRDKQLEDSQSGKLIVHVFIPIYVTYTNNQNKNVTFILDGYTDAIMTIDCKDGRFRIKNAEPINTYKKKMAYNGSFGELGKEYDEQWSTTRYLVNNSNLELSYRIGIAKWVKSLRDYVEKQKDDDF